MSSAFDNLCGPGKPLKVEPPDTKAFAGLLRSGKARLKDARCEGLALESRFNLAYNATRRWHDYRSGKCDIVFQLDGAATVRGEFRLVRRGDLDRRAKAFQSEFQSQRWAQDRVIRAGDLLRSEKGLAVLSRYQDTPPDGRLSRPDRTIAGQAGFIAAVEAGGA